MKIIQIIIVILLSTHSIFSQHTISGVIIEKGDVTMPGVNVYLEGSYDGGFTDANGVFSFETTLEGEQALVVSMLGYETNNIKDRVENLQNLRIKIRESAQTLDAVEITASTFKAGDNSKVAVLKPLDMVTTAGSNGDVIAAMKTLPGTQNNADDGRLFVRGGDASETAILIDGMRVFTPYTRTVSGTPARGRFSPFLFKGVSFSTGGYDAQFGQALSGVLDMNTTDESKQTSTNISLMTVGLGLGHSQKWDKQSISLNISYIDLAPYNAVVKSKLDVERPYHGLSGEAVYRYKTNEGLFKFYIARDGGEFKYDRFDINTQTVQKTSIVNSNYYANSTYHQLFGEKSTLNVGMSVGYNKDNQTFGDYNIQNYLTGVHSKISVKTFINDHFILDYGIDNIYLDSKNDIEISQSNMNYHSFVDRSISGIYTSTDYFFTKDFAVKVGLRGEYNSLSKKSDIYPRLTLANKISKNSQLSAAFGMYSQEVKSSFLYVDGNTLGNERSTHYLVNYNYKTNKNIVRFEAYYKGYDQLIKYDDDAQNFTNVTNEGDGYAYGLDVFWRANKWVKDTDFWVSYSWINTERNYQNYPIEATPSFITENTLSLVGKRWFSKLKSQLGLTYQYASGRAFENPNTTGFLNEKSSPYHNVSASWAYLISQQKILFFSVSNVFDRENEFGYRYANNPDPTGIYPGEIITPNRDSFIFLGFFMTISDDKKENQLDNL